MLVSFWPLKSQCIMSDQTRGNLKTNTANVRGLKTNKCFHIFDACSCVTVFDLRFQVVQFKLVNISTTLGEILELQDEGAITHRHSKSHVLRYFQHL